jgi:hypothetical protein
LSTALFSGANILGTIAKILAKKTHTVKYPTMLHACGIIE